MFAAVGVGAYAAGIFHLVTHAFFKALLFLGAGSVIHGLGGEQDLRKMGGLSPRMVMTTITMTVGALGLAGLPGLAGFFSKDEILAAAYASGHTVHVGAPAAGRVPHGLLHGPAAVPRLLRRAAHVEGSRPPRPRVARRDDRAARRPGAAHGRRPAWHSAFHRSTARRFARFLAPVVSRRTRPGTAASSRSCCSSSAVLVFAAGIGARLVHVHGPPVRPETSARPHTAVHALLLNAYYVDGLYDRVIVRPLLALSALPGRGLRPAADRRARQRAGPRGRRVRGGAPPAPDRLHRQLRAHDAGRRRRHRRLLLSR